MPSLRERKKADTHATIRQAAADLFLARGYEATTMEAVAEAANVSVRTVFRYFPTKEALFFGGVGGDLSDLRELLDARPRDESVMDSMRAVVEIFVGRIEEGEDVDRRLAPLLRDVPALRQHYLGVLDGVEVTVADWARDRLGAAASDLRPGLLAACVVSIQRVVVDAIVAGDDRPVADLVREAIDLLAKGFDQLER
jgi:TetR/AcrR family transcriptional regulator, regulator of mycofactocin system